MSKNNENESSWFDRMLATIQILDAISSVGGAAPQSQVEVEHRDDRPSIMEVISKQYEDFPGTAKNLSHEAQLEHVYEKSREEEQEKLERDVEISTLAANESSTSGSPTEVNNEVEATSEISSQSEVSLEAESNNVETPSENGFISEMESPSELAAEYEIALESESASGESMDGGFGSEGNEGAEGGGFGEGSYGEGGFGGGEGGEGGGKG